MRRKIYSTIFVMISLLITGICRADEWPSGYSNVPHLFVGGVTGAKLPSNNGENVILPMRGADEMRAICAHHGNIWLYGDSLPRKCNRLMAEDGVFQLWLAPAVIAPADDVRAPPRLLSSREFVQGHWRERGANIAEIEALRASLKLANRHIAVHEKGNIKAVDTFVSGITYLLVSGQHQLDGNGEEFCARTTRLLFLKSPNGVTYGGEIDANPFAYIGRIEGGPPDLLIKIECGKKMLLWRTQPQLHKVIEYDNGYEYGG